MAPWMGKFPGGGNGNPLPYSGLGNPMDRGAWFLGQRATFQRVTKGHMRLNPAHSSAQVQKKIQPHLASTRIRIVKVLPPFL